MRTIATMTTVILFVGGINAQQLEVIGKMIVEDINTIATFRSSAKNSFIRMETNGDPQKGASVGYLDELPATPGSDTYFYIDLPNGKFGDFIIRYDGNVGIGELDPSDKFTVVQTTSTLAAVAGYTVANDGIGVRGLGTEPGSKGVVGSGILCDFDATGPGEDYCSLSSKRWKTNINNITDPLDKLSKLRGVTFNWDKDHGGHYDIGFIAEEVGEIVPEIVIYEANGVDARGMDYSKMTPILIEASNALRKEYQDKFENQQSQINQLKDQVLEIDNLRREIAGFKAEIATMLGQSADEK